MFLFRKCGSVTFGKIARISQNNYADHLQYSTHNAFTFDEVSENDTLKLLCNLKESKSTGPDKINVRLVKDSAEVICPTLTKLFN